MPETQNQQSESSSVSFTSRFIPLPDEGDRIWPGLLGEDFHETQKLEAAADDDSLAILNADRSIASNLAEAGRQGWRNVAKTIGGALEVFGSDFGENMARRQSAMNRINDVDPEFQSGATGVLADTARALPNFAVQIGAGAATGGSATAFMAVGGAQVLADTYHDARQFHLDQGTDESSAHTTALFEATVNGLTTALTSAVPAYAIFVKTPMGQQVSRAAASSVLAKYGGRVTSAAFAEMAQEFGEAWEQEAAKLWIRQDPNAFPDGALGYTKDAFRQSLAGLVLGGTARAAMGVNASEETNATVTTPAVSAPTSPAAVVAGPAVVAAGVDSVADPVADTESVADADTGAAPTPVIEVSGDEDADAETEVQIDIAGLQEADLDVKDWRVVREMASQMPDSPDKTRVIDFIDAWIAGAPEPDAAVETNPVLRDFIDNELTDEQTVVGAKNAVGQMLAAIAEKSGAALRFASPKADGAKAAGVFVDNTGDIWINADAIAEDGRVAGTLGEETVIHELSHRLDKINPEAAARVRQIIGQDILAAANEDYVASFAEQFTGGDIEAARIELSGSLEGESFARAMEHSFAQWKKLNPEARAGFLATIREALLSLARTLGLGNRAKTRMANAFTEFAAGLNATTQAETTAPAVRMNPRPIGKKRVVKFRIEKLTGVIKVDNAVSDYEALKAKVKAEARGARRAFDVARSEAASKNRTSNARRLAKKQQEASDLRRRFSDLRTNFLRRAHKATLQAEETAGNRGFRIARKEAKAFMQELKTFVAENMPKRLHGKMLTAITDATSVNGLLKGMTQVARIMGKYERVLAQRRLREVLSSFSLNELNPRFRDRIMQTAAPIMGQLMTAGQVGRLTAMLNYASSVHGTMPDAMVEVATVTLKSIGDANAREIDLDRIKGLNKADANALADVIEHITHLNHTFNHISFGRQDRDLDQIRVAALSDIKSQPPMKRNRVLDFLRGTQADRDTKKTMPGTLVERVMDADTLTATMGKTWHELFMGIRRAFRGYSGLMFAGVDKLHNAMRDVGFEPGGLNVRTWADEPIEKFGHTLRRSQWMEVAAVALDPDNFGEMVKYGIKSGLMKSGDPIKLTQQQLIDVISGLDAKEWAMVSAMREFVNGQARDAANVESVRRLGFELFTRPGYWRRIRTSEEKDRGEDQLAQGMRNITIEGLGIQKRRTGDDTAIVINSVFESYHKIVHQLGVIAHMESPIRSMLRVMGDSDVGKAMTIGYGSQRHVTLTEFLNNSTLLSQANDALGGIATLERNAALFALGFHPLSAMRNLGGLLTLGTQLPAAKIVANLPKIASPTAWHETWEWIVKHAPDLRGRYEGESLKLVTPRFGEGGIMFGGASFLARVKENPLNPFKHVLHIGTVRDKALDLIHYADFINTLVAVNVARQMATEQGQSDEWAAETAAMAIARTQNPANPIDMSVISMQFRRNALARMFTMFRSQSMKNLSLLAREWHKVDASNPSSMASFARTAGLVYSGSVLTAVSIGAMFDMALDTAFGERDEDRKKLKAGEALAWRSVTEFADAIPFFGTFVQSIKGVREYGEWSRIGAESSANPIERGFGAIAQAVGALAKNVLESNDPWTKTGDDGAVKINSVGEYLKEQDASQKQANRMFMNMADGSASLFGIPGWGFLRSLTRKIESRSDE